MPQKKKSAESSSIEVMQEVSFSTHLPPPQIIERYNEIIPSFAEDVHNEFLNETKARRSYNNWIVKGTIGSRIFGQILGFGIAVFVLYIAWDLGVKGHDGLAGTIAVIDLVALVSVFVGVQYFGKEREKQSETQDKNHKEED